MPSLSTKMTNPQKSIMLLILREVRICRFRLFKINLNLSRRWCNFYYFDSLTLGGLEEETKFVECVSDTEMLFIKPRPVLSKGDF